MADSAISRGLIIKRERWKLFIHQMAADKLSDSKTQEKWSTTKELEIICERILSRKDLSEEERAYWKKRLEWVKKLEEDERVLG